MTSQPFHGVLVPVLTPFMPNGEPDYLDFHRDEFDVVWPARVEEERRANHR